MPESIPGSPTASPKKIRGFFRLRLNVLFWIGAILALAVLAHIGEVGWDAQVYWKTIQALHRGVDPYAEGIAAQEAFHARLAFNAGQHMPFSYLYSPLTLPLLRPLGLLPGWLLVVLYTITMAAGFSLQMWSGFQLAAKSERRCLALLLPAVVFFPGLINEETILSGNVAYLLYGLILAASVPGWKRGNWTWYYLAVVVASIFKMPFLTMLAFPLLVGARQWISASFSALAGLFIFAAQARVWPELFREYLLAVRLEFAWNDGFGANLPGVIGKCLRNAGRPYSSTMTIVYLVFAAVLGILLLVLMHRVQRGSLSRETWIPVALIGTLLLNPRIMRYDLAAFTVPMLIIGWRALQISVKHFFNENERAQGRPNYPLIFAGATCFLAPNLIAEIEPRWLPIQLPVLLVIFSMGVWSLHQARIPYDQAPSESLVPAWETA